MNGYKVCYKQDNKYTTLYLMHTYKKARREVQYLRKYPPPKLKTKKWKIIPITKKEVNEGIWDGPPFIENFEDYY